VKFKRKPKQSDKEESINEGAQRGRFKKSDLFPERNLSGGEKNHNPKKAAVLKMGSKREVGEEHRKKSSGKSNGPSCVRRSLNRGRENENLKRYTKCLFDTKSSTRDWLNRAPLKKRAEGRATPNRLMCEGKGELNHPC